MNQPNQPAQVQEKAPKPQGLLPKNVQSWLLLGLAFLMVAIMWLTGGKKPVTPSKAAPPTPSVLPPLEVNEAKIIDTGYLAIGTKKLPFARRASAN